jgi:hypothetical protein
VPVTNTSVTPMPSAPLAGDPGVAASLTNTASPSVPAVAPGGTHVAETNSVPAAANAAKAVSPAEPAAKAATLALNDHPSTVPTASGPGAADTSAEASSPGAPQPQPTSQSRAAGSEAAASVPASVTPVPARVHARTVNTGTLLLLGLATCFGALIAFAVPRALRHRSARHSEVSLITRSLDRTTR